MSRRKLLLLCVFYVVLYSCTLEDLSPALAGIECIDSKTIKVSVLISDAAIPYEVDDNTLSVYSTKHDLYYRIDGTEKLSKAEYKCFLRKDIKPGDRIRADGNGSLSGSVCLDVPGEE
jgi:hypothetical protein